MCKYRYSLIALPSNVTIPNPNLTAMTRPFKSTTLNCSLLTQSAIELQGKTKRRFEATVLSNFTEVVVML